MDTYGFRPLIPALMLLSAYEFYMYWRCEPLLPPFEYRYESEERTVWTAAGEALYAKGCRYRNEVQFVPGTHFTVVQSPTGSYVTFPAMVGKNNRFCSVTPGSWYATIALMSLC